MQLIITAFLNCTFHMWDQPDHIQLYPSQVGDQMGQLPNNRKFLFSYVNPQIVISLLFLFLKLFLLHFYSKISVTK